MKPKELYPYQESAAETLRQNYLGGALFMEPGLGKTITALSWWGGYGKLIVVCPISAIGVWHSELAGMGYPTPLLPSGPKARVKHIATAQRIVINYEALLNKEVLTALRKMEPYSLILDESQRIKTPSAKRTKAALTLSDGMPTAILTGTPITKNYLDLYSQFRAIDPGIWDRISFTKFKQRYAVMGGYLNYEVVGFRNLDDLERRIAPYTHRLRKADALSLPPQTDQEVPIYMSRNEWRAYKELANGGLWEDAPVPNPLVRALRLHQMVGEAKLSATFEQIREVLEAGEKVVVFYKYTEEGEKIASHLSSKAKYVHLHGGVAPTVRTSIIDKFQNSDVQVFLAQIDAGSVAITLTSSSNVIYHSVSWSYEAAVQSRDRVHRVGQTRPVLYKYVRMVGPEGQQTIDHLIAEAIDRKEDFASLVMSGTAKMEVT